MEISLQENNRVFVSYYMHFDATKIVLVCSHDIFIKYAHTSCFSEEANAVFVPFDMNYVEIQLLLDVCLRQL